VAYKVLRDEHARSLIHDGEMMWSTLAWFQNLEEAERGDDCEGRHMYFPVNGDRIWIPPVSFTSELETMSSTHARPLDIPRARPTPNPVLARPGA
jgi:hypothetical protein